jgi:CheY-like chemotaxis protein
LESDRKYDAIITDIEMPEVNGNFIAKPIRASEKEHTPLFAITGTPEDQCQSHFFDFIIKKPFKLKELQTALELVIYRYVCIY